MSNDLLDKGMPSPKSKKKEDLNNVNGILAMGITSIVLSFFLGGLLLGMIPLLLGALAITKGRQAMSLYSDYPDDYTESSYGKGKAGFICGIIGVGIWLIMRLMTFLILSA